MCDDMALFPVALLVNGIVLSQNFQVFAVGIIIDQCCIFMSDSCWAMPASKVIHYTHSADKHY